MLKGKLWMLTAFQSRYRVQKIDDSKSLDAKHLHPTDAKIASTNMDAKIASTNMDAKIASTNTDAKIA